MIILDTNVLSELVRPAPTAQVLGWVDRHLAATLFTSTITVGEMLYGVELIPPGKRRDALQVATTRLFEDEFRGRILTYDVEAAEAYARICAERRKLGHPISKPDAQVAAIALSQGASVATRNIRDFENCGIELINPWGDQPMG